MSLNESQARILVADDDEDILNLVALMLEREGYAVLRARDGVEAVDVAFAERPDLLVLDVMMPKQDGFAVMRTLRDAHTTEAMPILLLTASVQEQQRERGFQAGADAFVRKPFSPRELLGEVARLLEGVRPLPATG
jgi:DNA-binding response OmpR family regulator